MKVSQATLHQYIDESTSKLSDHELRQAQHEYRAIEPLIASMGISFSSVTQRYKVPIDFEVDFDGKKIAIEVTDVRPYLEKHKVAKRATERVVANIIKEYIGRESIPYFQIDIILKEKTYHAKNLNHNDEFRREIQELLRNGVYKHPQYVESFFKREYPDVSIKLDELSFNFQYEGFLRALPSNCIYDAIANKEAKLPEYKKLYKEYFDEYWLCVDLPYEERGYTIRGTHLCDQFSSEYNKIFMTQQLPPKTILLYHK